MMTHYKALVSEKNEKGEITQSIQSLSDDSLPKGDVVVHVEYSTVNYKDGLCLNGLGRLVRDYPHVTGIDFAGTVASSSDIRFSAGDRVVLTGWRVGEIWWGGHAGKACVKADWLVKLPETVSTRRAMAVGTAGFTAMAAVEVLEKHDLSAQKPGAVLVTGAAGGVGSVAVAILSHLGYDVTALTGRLEESGYLENLGARAVIGREEMVDAPSRPLDKERWSGCIDSVGGNILAHVLCQMRYGCSVAAVGLAGGVVYPGSVVPFLLRGVNLLGIDSVFLPYGRRVEIWRRIAQDLPGDKIDAMVQEIGLADVVMAGKDILAGKVRGRLIVAV